MRTMGISGLTLLIVLLSASVAFANSPLTQGTYTCTQDNPTSGTFDIEVGPAGMWIKLNGTTYDWDPVDDRYESPGG